MISQSYHTTMCNDFTCFWKNQLTAQYPSTSRFKALSQNYLFRLVSIHKKPVMDCIGFKSHWICISYERFKSYNNPVKACSHCWIQLEFCKQNQCRMQMSQTLATTNFNRKNYGQHLIDDKVSANYEILIVEILVNSKKMPEQTVYFCKARRVCLKTSLLGRLQPRCNSTNRHHLTIQQNCHNYWTSKAIWMPFKIKNLLQFLT